MEFLVFSFTAFVLKIKKESNFGITKHKKKFLKKIVYASADNLSFNIKFQFYFFLLWFCSLSRIIRKQGSNKSSKIRNSIKEKLNIKVQIHNCWWNWSIREHWMIKEVLKRNLLNTKYSVGFDKRLKVCIFLCYFSFFISLTYFSTMTKFITLFGKND